MTFVKNQFLIPHLEFLIIKKGRRIRRPFLNLSFRRFRWIHPENSG